MYYFYNFSVYLLAFSLAITGKIFANNNPYHFENSSAQHTVLSAILSTTEITYDGTVLEVNTAFINDLGTNNFSTNHYEYFITLSDGVYVGNNQFIGGTYSINIELLSIGNSFNYGNFQSCFFCDQTTAFSYVGHLFLIEDTNDDDIIDFNTDPFTDGSNTGFVNISQTNGMTTLEIDFTMDDGKELKGCHTGEFPIDPDLTTLSVSEVSPTTTPSIKIHANPVKDIIKFEIENFSNKIYSFQIYTSEGKLITNRITKNGYQEIDIRNWSTTILGPIT